MPATTRLSIQEELVDISLYDGVLTLGQLAMTVTSDDIAAHTIGYAEFLPNFFCSFC